MQDLQAIWNFWSSANWRGWVTKPFKNWKKAVEKMKAHSRSDSHSHATQAMLAAKRAVGDGTVVQQLQNVEAHKRAQNRAAMKCLILLTHFLTKEHVAHSTKFEKLVDVVVRCGSQQLKQYLETAPRNATYTSRVAVVEFIGDMGGGVNFETSSKDSHVQTHGR